jgi:small-conductance mechanosensitive channel
MRHFTLNNLTLSFVLMMTTSAHADVTDTTHTVSAVGSPVVLSGDTLFFIRSRLGPFSPEDRAKAIAERAQRLMKTPSARVETVRIVDGETTTDILVDDLVLMTITDGDAQAAGRTRSQLASDHARILSETLKVESTRRSVKGILLGVLLTLIATVVLVVILKLSRKAFAKIDTTLDSWRTTRLPSLKIQTLELLPADRIADMLISLVKMIRIAFVVLLLYFYVSLILSFFPWTRGAAATLADYILSPLKTVWHAFITYLPNVFFIIVIIVVTRYITKFIQLIFTEVEKGAITLPGFYKEWAEPTYKIIRFLIIAFAVMVVFPYLPGSSSPAFRGVSLFLGVLFSLGSAGAVSNIVAGVILTYMRAFTVGDRVKIADTAGDVIEKTLLVTRVRTIKNVEITIPNAMVLGSHIINFNTAAREYGLILHTTVTIGYDAPWRKVHDLLIAAARSTQHILKEPPPFVLQTSLNDFYVSYELNAYTDKPNGMAKIYSELHQNIQDKFNEAGVEIMSPHYSALRDGNQVTIPENYLPRSYTSPAFKIFPLSNALNKPNDKGSQES